MPESLAATCATSKTMRARLPAVVAIVELALRVTAAILSLVGIGFLFYLSIALGRHLGIGYAVVSDCYDHGLRLRKPHLL